MEIQQVKEKPVQAGPKAVRVSSPSWKKSDEIGRPGLHPGFTQTNIPGPSPSRPSTASPGKTDQPDPDLSNVDQNDTWRKALIWAVDTGEYSYLRTFCANAPDDPPQCVLYTPDEHGDTLFIRAVRRKRVDIVKLLLDHSEKFFKALLADVKWEEDLGFGSILRAIIFDRELRMQINQRRRPNRPVALFHALVKKYVSMRKDYWTRKPILESLDFASTFRNTKEWLLIKQWASAAGLHDALTECNAGFNKIQRFEVLDTKVVEDDSSDLDGSQGKVEVVLKRYTRELKLEMVHKRISSPEDTGWTALHVAASTGNKGMLEPLLKAYDEIYDTLPKRASKLNFSDKSWMTPLHYAALKQDVETAKILLGSAFYAAYVNDGDLSMRTPLHIACTGVPRCKIVPTVSLVEAFLEKQFVDVNAKDCCGFTALHWAVYVAATDIVELILCHSISKSKSPILIRTTDMDHDGRTVLNYVRKHAELGYPYLDRTDQISKIDEMEWLLSHNPDVKNEEARCYRDRQVYVDAANAILVGAALIASVTFGGWLQPPASFEDFTQIEVQVFWFFNSLSFCFAIATVMAGAAAVLPVTDVYIKVAVERTRELLALTSFLLIVSTIFVLGAFGAAGFASLSQVTELKKNMIATISLGMVVCFVIMLMFFNRLIRIPIEWSQLLLGVHRLFVKPATLQKLEHLKKIEHCRFDHQASFKRGRHHVDFIRMKELWKFLAHDALDFWEKAEKYLEAKFLLRFYESLKEEFRKKSADDSSHPDNDPSSVFRRSTIADALTLEHMISEWAQKKLDHDHEFLEEKENPTAKVLEKAETGESHDPSRPLPELPTTMLLEGSQYISDLFGLQYLTVGRGLIHLYFKIDISSCRLICIKRDEKSVHELRDFELSQKKKVPRPSLPRANSLDRSQASLNLKDDADDRDAAAAVKSAVKTNPFI